MSCDLKIKRKKSSVFSKEEEMRLLESIYLERGFIENKETNKCSNSEKDMAWGRVCLAFNASALEYRSIEQLKSKFDNLKTKVRKVIASERAHLKGTGGGGPYTNVDPVVELLLKIVNEKMVVGLDNTVDSDYIAVTPHNAANVTPSVSIDDTHVIWELQGNEGDVSFKENDMPLKELNDNVQNDTKNIAAESTRAWNDYTPRHLKEPVSKKLQLVRTSSLAVAKEEYYKKKLLMLEDEEQFRQEQRKREEEKHKKEMELLDMQLRIRRAELELIQTKLK